MNTRAFLASLAFAGTLAASGASASTINGGTLLSTSDADQLEEWLGVGEQVFTNIYTGYAEQAVIEDFLAAASGVGPTFSIYGITLHDGSNAKIGGYTTLDWGSSTGFHADADAFIFNLTTGEVQFEQEEPSSAVRTGGGYFPTFGRGRDIFAGYDTLGTCDGRVSRNCDGHSDSYSFDLSQGQITVAGDWGSGHGSSGIDSRDWSVDSLEVFVFQPFQATSGADPVESVPIIPNPLPAGLPLMLGCLGGLGWLASRKRKSS